MWLEKTELNCHLLLFLFHYIVFLEDFNNDENKTLCGALKIANIVMLFHYRISEIYDVVIIIFS